MKDRAKLLYNLNRLVLFLLALSFLSLFLLSVEGFDFLIPVAENITQYLPLLLIPVLITMVVVLLIRYLTKGSDEAIGIEDFLAGIAAVAAQAVTIITYGLVSGNDTSFSLGLPDLSAINPTIGDAIERTAAVVNDATQKAQAAIAGSADSVSEKAAQYGWLGVAGLQSVAFIAYWIADPDPKN